MTRRLTRKEAAADLGISRQRLEKLIAERRIEEDPDGIDIEKARAARARGTDIGRQLAYRETRKKVGRAQDQDAASAGEPDRELFDFVEARARRESWNAKRAEVTYKEKVGDLIPRAAVEVKEFEIGRMARDRILGWPARLAGVVSNEAMVILTREAEQLCRDLQEGCVRIAQEAGF